MRKQLLSMLLCMCMMVSLLPVSALAADDEGRPSAADWFNSNKRQPEPEQSQSNEQEEENTSEPTPAMYSEMTQAAPTLQSGKPTEGQFFSFAPDKSDVVSFRLNNEGTLIISGNGPIQKEGKALEYWDTSNGYDAPMSGSGSPFAGNENIKAAVIENGVTDIPEGLFQNCVNLTSVSIANSVTYIGDHAFENCYRLGNIKIPGNVTSIGAYAFANCSTSNLAVSNGDGTSSYTGPASERLTSIVIPDSVTSIGEHVFDGCDELENVTLPKNLTSIADYMFKGCSSLPQIAIPNGVTRIGSYAFSGCPISYCAIPNQVTAIGDYAFSGCLFRTIMIPDGVTSIGSGAFARCENLASIEIPNSVTAIGAEAFMECGNLTSATISNKVETIESHTFSGCGSLTNIFIPVSVKGVKYGAFVGCEKLSDVYYGGSEEQWKAIIFPEAEPGMPNNPTMHWNSIGIGKSENTNRSSDKNIYFFSRWDGSTKQAVFADDNDRPYRFAKSAKMIGAESIEALLNNFVLVEIDPSDPFLITSIELLQTKVDTVSNPGTGLISFESEPGRIFVTDLDLELETFKGNTVLYHMNSKGEIVFLEPLEERHGKLKEWNSTSHCVLIDDTSYPTNNLTDLSSFLPDLLQICGKDVVFYVSSSTGVRTLYKIDANKKIITETKVGILNFYDGFNVSIDNSLYAVNENQIGNINNFMGRKVFFLLENNKLIHMFPTDELDIEVRVSFDPNDKEITYKSGQDNTVSVPAKISIRLIGENMGQGYNPQVVYDELEKSNKSVIIESVTWNSDLRCKPEIEKNLKIGLDGYQKNLSIKLPWPYFAKDEPDKHMGTLVIKGRKNGKEFTERANFNLTIINPNATPKEDNEEKAIDDSNNWENSLLKTFYEIEDVDITVQNQWPLSSYFDDSVIDDIGKAVTVWITAINSPLAKEVKGDLPPYLKITCTMNKKNKKHSASIWFRESNWLEGLIGNYGSASDLRFTLMDNDSKRILAENQLYSFHVSASAKKFADATNVYLKKNYGKSWLDFTKKLMKNAIDESIKDFAKVSGHEYINTMLNLLKDYKSVAGNAKKFTEYAGKAADILKNPINLESATTKDFNACCKQISVECPVDVYIYNEEHELCGAIVNNEIVTDTLEVFMDVIGDKKAIFTSNDYTIKLVATDVGTMNYSIEELAENDNSRLVSFNNIPLAEGIEYNCSIPEAYDIQASDYALNSSTGKVIYASSDTKQNSKNTNNNNQITTPSANNNEYSNSPRRQIHKDSAHNEDQSVSHVVQSVSDSSNGWANPFIDIDERAWYYPAVQYVSKSSLMTGAENNYTFAPKANLSRAMLAQILYNREGNPEVAKGSRFGDVPNGAWYENAITWTAEEGIVSGYEDGRFAPNDPVTREQFAVMLWRYSGSPSASTENLTFNDIAAVRSYALEAMAWAVSNNIISGYEGNWLAPGEYASRVQVAQMLKNYLDK